MDKLETSVTPVVPVAKVAKAAKVAKPPKAPETPKETEAPTLVLYAGLDAHFRFVEEVLTTDRYLIEYRLVPSVEHFVKWHVRVFYPSDPELTRPVYVRTVGCELDADGKLTERLSFGEVW